MNQSEKATDRAVLLRLGERISEYRLSRNMTQAQLAKEAGVSKRTVLRLESGESSQLTNLVRVLRALGLVGNLDELVPEPLASPLAALKAKGRTRKRASGRTKKPSGSGTGWTWGDDAGGDDR